MPLDLNRVRQVAAEHFGEQPHPAAPTLKVKEYAAYARAAMVRSNNFVSAKEVEAMAAELKGLNLSPSDWEREWRRARPVANRLLGRDPDPQEIAHFRDQDTSPNYMHDYYYNHPHPQYPEVKAGDVMRHWHTAYPVAKALANRPPVLREVVRGAQAGYTADDYLAHYSDALSDYARRQ